MSKQRLTVDEVRRMFSYDPLVGVFVRREARGSNGMVGSVAGAKHPHGYTQIKIAGRQHLAHRLAWLYMTGEWPQDRIDHINGDKADNRFSNLRDVSQSVNLQNRHGAQANNQLGCLGVSRKSARFVAKLQVDGKRMRIGSYPTKEQARAAYLKAKRALHEGCTI